MGSKERREREKRGVRDMILETARDMFVTEGFQSVTMRKLAKRIEYSPTAIYLHFKDKESLIAELCRTDLAALTSSIHTLTDPLPVEQRMPVAAVAYVRFALAHPAQYRLLFMMPKPAPAPDAAANQADFLEPDREAYMFLRDNFAGLVAAGFTNAKHQDPDMLAQVYFCGLHGIVATFIAMGECRIDAWHAPEKQAEAFVSIYLDAILKK